MIAAHISPRCGSNSSNPDFSIPVLAPVETDEHKDGPGSSRPCGFCRTPESGLWDQNSQQCHGFPQGEPQTSHTHGNCRAWLPLGYQNNQLHKKSAPVTRGTGSAQINPEKVLMGASTSSSLQHSSGCEPGKHAPGVVKKILRGSQGGCESV